MRMYDIILKKRNGERLSDEEIGFFIDGYTRGEIPDYQASALCMAICLRGMDDDETAALTYSMARSGDMLDLSRFGELSSDKHSTGGVGDKTSLIVGPIAAALGAKVTKMSGQGDKDVRQRAGSHRRHGGQARIHPRYEDDDLARRVPRPVR